MSSSFAVEFSCNQDWKHGMPRESLRRSYDTIECRSEELSNTKYSLHETFQGYHIILKLYRDRTQRHASHNTINDQLGNTTSLFAIRRKYQWNPTHADIWKMTESNTTRLGTLWLFQNLKETESTGLGLLIFAWCIKWDLETAYFRFYNLTFKTSDETSECSTKNLQKANLPFRHLVMLMHLDWNRISGGLGKEIVQNHVGRKSMRQPHFSTFRLNLESNLD